MVRIFPFTVRKAHKSWLLVGEEDKECYFLFDEPPENMRDSRKKLRQFVDRCIFDDLDSDILVFHNIKFHRLGPYQKECALKKVVREMYHYYNPDL